MSLSKPRLLAFYLQYIVFLCDFKLKNKTLFILVIIVSPITYYLLKNIFLVKISIKVFDISKNITNFIKGF